MSSSQLRTFKEVIKRAAEAEGIKPYEVTRKQARPHYTDDISDYLITNLGGFAYLKEMLFPAPPGPFDIEGIKDWTKKAIVDYLAELIEKAADYCGIAPHECTWSEFAKFVQWRWGQNEKNIPRHIITRAGGFNRIRDARFKIEPTETVVAKRRLAIDSALNRKESVEKADKQYIFEQLSDSADKFKGVFKDYSPPHVVADRTNKILHLVMSDDHYGANLEASEVGIDFGAIQEARRTASVVKQFIEFAEKPGQYRVKLWILGDIIQGQLHDARDGAPLAEQMIRAMSMLSQVVVVLSAHFKSVDVYFATGNHGRNKARHPQRAVHQKWDSLETPLYFHVKSSCSELKNVTFTLPKTPFVVAEAYGFKFFGTHGDTVINPGTPSKTIAVRDMEYQSTKLSAAYPGGYAAFIFGHIHQFGHIIPGNKIPFISNAPLIPPDSFAWSIGVPDTLCGQAFFETRPHRAVFFAGNLDVGLEDDVNESLDSIIRPWAGF